ncbi:hypothetical protein [Methanobrevibacter sp.]|uniref:hypothetical protein n=1 Tax=Methanobrevibacter sp. TaxID=66852 RepID=UPI00261C0CD8|nr:hypothetical protein [uncultured Methanobrevibacter sp.]
MNLLIFLAILIAIVLRIWIEKGYFLLPKIYTKDGKTYFQLNILGTVFTALITVLILYQAQPELFTSFIPALVTAYTVPHLFDNIVTKVMPDE